MLRSNPSSSSPLELIIFYVKDSVDLKFLSLFYDRTYLISIVEVVIKPVISRWNGFSSDIDGLL